ncbi:uncharacterized protein LOC111888893 isoform X2 [Lactuca sativa]|uniref:uncharacterized protein LOC111888893 isoform X2 n=1 Tax=Lactuca sativa TaxID=4236 RepID=UPI001C68F445|nr:uncharacterized protein LOC111888893 isoform X2 [Lactuca sativa]
MMYAIFRRSIAYVCHIGSDGMVYKIIFIAHWSRFRVFADSLMMNTDPNQVQYVLSMQMRGRSSLRRSLCCFLLLTPLRGLISWLGLPKRSMVDELEAMLDLVDPQPRGDGFKGREQEMEQEMVVQ